MAGLGDQQRQTVGTRQPIPAAQYVRMFAEHQQLSTQNQRDAIAEYSAARGYASTQTSRAPLLFAADAISARVWATPARTARTTVCRPSRGRSAPCTRVNEKSNARRGIAVWRTLE